MMVINLIFRLESQIITMSMVNMRITLESIHIFLSCVNMVFLPNGGDIDFIFHLIINKRKAFYCSN